MAVVGLSGCGADASPAASVPELAEHLDAVDAAVVEEDWTSAQAALEDLTRATTEAQDAGELAGTDAEAILAAADRLESRLPEAPKPEPTPKPTPTPDQESTPDSPLPQPAEPEDDEKEDEIEGGDDGEGNGDESGGNGDEGNGDEGNGDEGNGDEGNGDEGNGDEGGGNGPSSENGPDDGHGN